MISSCPFLPYRSSYICHSPPLVFFFFPGVSNFCWVQEKLRKGLSSFKDCLFMLPVLNLLAELWPFYQKLLPVSVELILKVFCETFRSSAYLSAHSPQLSAPTEKQAAPLLAITALSSLPESQTLWSAQLRSYLSHCSQFVFPLCISYSDGISGSF